MTRERAKKLLPIITAFANGEEVEYYNIVIHSWSDWVGPFEAGDTRKFRIKPKKTVRLMTRNEVLGFVANTPGIVVKVGSRPENLGTLSFDSEIQDYKWATITPEGVIGEWKKFEKEV